MHRSLRRHATAADALRGALRDSSRWLGLDPEKGHCSYRATGATRRIIVDTRHLLEVSDPRHIEIVLKDVLEIDLVYGGLVGISSLDS